MKKYIIACALFCMPVYAISSTPYLDEQLTAIQNKHKYKKTQYKSEIPEPIIRPVTANANSQPQKAPLPTFGKNTLVYTSTPNDPKTYGRKIRVEYPKDWLAEPGISPHIVYKFTDTKYAPGLLKGRACLIEIKDLNELFTDEDVFLEDVSLLDWKIVFNDPDLVNSMLGANVLYSQVTQADNLPALMAMSEMQQEQLGIKVYAKMLSTSVGYKNTIIHLQCMAMGGDKNSADKVFNESKKLFLSFMNSFKCMDRWENMDMEDEYTYATYKKLVAMTKSNMTTDDYQELAKFLSEIADVGGMCITTQEDLKNIKQHPNVLLATTGLGSYYMFTHWIKDYCAPYNTISYNNISKLKNAITPYKERAEKKITEIMGAQHLQCLKTTLSTSEYGKLLAYESLDKVCTTAKISKQNLCAAFNDNREISATISTLSKTFTSMGL